MSLVIRGYSDSEIADELSISGSTVRTQRRIAYQKLNIVLKPVKQFLSFL